jgi:hypothetical protein
LGVVAVNLWTVLTWSLAIVVGIAILFAMIGAITGDGGAASAFQRLVPPEIWDNLSPVVRASIRVVAQSDEQKRERLKKVLLRLADGYLEEKRSPAAQQAYVSVLLETLGRLTL